LARRAEALAAQLNHAYSVAWCNTWGSVVDLWLGQTARAAARNREGTRLARENDYAYMAAMGEMIAGWIEGQEGDPAGGAQRVAAGLAAFASTGAEIVVPFFETVRAELLVGQGRHQEALELLARAGGQVERGGERWQEAEVHRVRANALWELGGEDRRSEAEAGYRRALEIAAVQGARAWQLRAASDLAGRLRETGRSAEAGEMLDPILAAYEGELETPDLARARRLRKRLGPQGRG
jgi:predicted ATPase